MRKSVPPKVPHPSKCASLADLQAALGDFLSPAKLLENPKPPTECATATGEKKILEKIFPHGLPTGELIECLYRGSGCSTLALCLARTASRDGRAIAVIDPSSQFYPHPAVALGIEPQQLVIVRPARGAEEMWALDHAIRCRGLAAVLWRGERLALRHLRRLQLACEKYDTLGILLRPQKIARQLTAARTRLRVEAIDAIQRTSAAPQRKTRNLSLFFRHRIRVERLRGAHLAAGNGIELEIDYESGTFRQAAPLPLAS